jgi:hypothetical protein
VEPEQATKLGVLRVLQIIDKSFRIIKFNDSAERIGCITKVTVAVVDFDSPADHSPPDRRHSRHCVLQVLGKIPNV